MSIAYNTRNKKFELLEIDFTENTQAVLKDGEWSTQTGYAGYGDVEIGITIPQFIQQIASLDQLLQQSVQVIIKTVQLESISPVECIQYTFKKPDSLKRKVVQIGTLDIQKLQLRDRYGLNANDSQDLEYDQERQTSEWNDIAVELMSHEWDSTIYSSYTSLYMHELAIGNETVENIQSIAGLFSSIKSISIDFGDADLDRFSSWDKLFRNQGLVSIDLNKFNGDKVQQMYRTFDGCKQLKSLDMHNFSGKSLEIMQNTFSNCYNLKHIDISNLDTQNVQTMYRIFNQSMAYNKADPQDISLDIQNCTTLYEAFESQHIKKLTLTNKLGTKGILEDITQVFQNATIDQIDMRQVDTSGVQFLRYCFYGHRTNDYLDNRRLTDGAVFISNHKELGISLDEYMQSQIEDIIKLDCKRRGIDYDSGNCRNQYILAELDTSNIKEIDATFRDQDICSVNLSYCDLRHVVWMDWAFAEMNKLNYFKLYEPCEGEEADSCVEPGKPEECGVKKMPELVSMSSMFQGSAVYEVVLKINAKELLQIKQIFDGCPVLKTVDMGQMETPRLQTLSRAFACCQYLEEVDLSNMTTLNVGKYDHQKLFMNDISLKNIKISEKTQSKAAVLVEEFMKRNQVVH